ncbi:MAG: hypothetical protein HQ581_03380 [Planctomycetes bacterium]|nr:hypothetical protein [Planctomycetota bacterium]
MKCKRCGVPYAVDRALVDERFPEIRERLQAVIDKSLKTPVSGPKLSIDELMELIESKKHATPDPEEAKEDRQIESLAPSCECGGEFRLRASSRCPKCRSNNFRKDPNGMEMHAS